jgi:hypothetical protein
MKHSTNSQNNSTNDSKTGCNVPPSMGVPTRVREVTDLVRLLDAIGVPFHSETFRHLQDYIMDSSDGSKRANVDLASKALPDSPPSLAPISSLNTSPPYTLLSIQSGMDVRLLQVNRRYHKSHALPPDVRKSMDDLRSLAQWTMAAQMPFETGTFSKKTRFTVSLTFTFPTLGSDIDGPIKRTLDSVFRGMREAYDDPNINDTRIIELHVTKRVGEPSLAIEVDVVA